MRRAPKESLNDMVPRKKTGLRELALFAGAGGGILGGLLHGWRTVAAVEIEDYPRRVLLQRQADGIIPRFPVWDDVRTFDGRQWRGKVDIVTGGFPCQDISSAGKGAGITGERSGLWKEMARIIGEVRPKYAFVENSPLLIRRGLTTVLGDLAEMGYDAQWGVFGAHTVGAPHKRDRIWIVANARGGRCCEQKKGKMEQSRRTKVISTSYDWWTCKTCGKEWPQPEFEQCHECTEIDELISDAKDAGWKTGANITWGCDWPKMAHSEQTRLERLRSKPGESKVSESGDGGTHFSDSDKTGRDGRSRPRQKLSGRKKYSDRSWWSAEPDVGRVANGVANRVDRIKAIGNGQVPAVAALAWEILNHE